MRFANDAFGRYDKVTGEWLEALGFDQREIDGVTRWVFDLPTDVDDCFCALHFLPCEHGWIVEVWNWQGELCDVEQRAAFPHPLRSRHQILSLLMLVKG